MSNLQAHIIQKKRQKRERFNRLLEGLREPRTCQQLEDDLGATRNYFTHAVTMLADYGYVKKVGNIGRTNIWQAISFDYREDGMDYESPISFYQAPTLTPTTLADAVYRHNPDDFRDKHNDTSALLRRERKSPRVWVSGAQTYA